MDAPEGSPQPEQVVEITYPVNLTPDLFTYLAESLQPVYESQLSELKKDGSFKGLQEFHHSSRIARLMTNILDQYPDSNTLPDNPSLNLSPEDVKFIKDITFPPLHASAVERKIHTGRMELLRIEFEKAKKEANKGTEPDSGGSFLDNLKSRFKK